MDQYKFFQKILSQLENLQTAINDLREIVKEQIHDANL